MDNLDELRQGKWRNLGKVSMGRPLNPKPSSPDKYKLYRAKVKAETRSKPGQNTRPELYTACANPKPLNPKP